jgi:hypothetical protein
MKNKELLAKLNRIHDRAYKTKMAVEDLIRELESGESKSFVIIEEK